MGLMRLSPTPAGFCLGLPQKRESGLFYLLKILFLKKKDAPTCLSAEIFQI